MEAPANSNSFPESSASLRWLIFLRQALSLMAVIVLLILFWIYHDNRWSYFYSFIPALLAFNLLDFFIRLQCIRNISPGVFRQRLRIGSVVAETFSSLLIFVFVCFLIVTMFLPEHSFVLPDFFMVFYVITLLLVYILDRFFRIRYGSMILFQSDQVTSSSYRSDVISIRMLKSIRCNQDFVEFAMKSPYRFLLFQNRVTLDRRTFDEQTNKAFEETLNRWILHNNFKAVEQKEPET